MIQIDSIENMRWTARKATTEEKCEFSSLTLLLHANFKTLIFIVSRPQFFAQQWMTGCQNNSPIFNWLALQELHSNVRYIFLPFWQVSHLSLITFKACYYLDVLIYLKEVFVLLTLTVQTWFMLCQLLTICWRQRHSSQGPCGTYAGHSPHQKLGKKASTSVLAFYRVVFSQMGFGLELHRPISYGNPRLSEHAE